jgi:osmotically-inducible protein OsmY
MKSIISKALVLSSFLIGAPVLAATPDGLITTKSKLSLLTTGGVRGSAVHVDTNDGIVTLYGKVPTQEQKIAAEKAITGVGGVRQVKNLLQVVPDSDAKRVERADKEIKDNVEKMLKDDVALSDSKIGVKSVDKGVVLLNGKAATVSDHLRAVAVADEVAGVRRVATEVESPDQFSDKERPIFINDGRADSMKADAKMKKDEIKADAKMKKDEIKAETAVKSRDTKNSLDDMRISSAVKLRLWTTANVPSTEINVDTRNNVVTLFGMVPTPEAKTLAENEAAKVDGVTKIENQLQVVPRSSKELVEAKDKDVQNNLKAVFKDRAELKGVNSDVKNGVVRLTGTVDSGWDKLNAVRLARTTPGVRGVEEQLAVKGDGEVKRQF